MVFFITKDMVFDARQHGGVLELSSNTVMTPLARETAEKLGVVIQTGAGTHRRPLMVANWKMNHGAAATVSFFETLLASDQSAPGVDMLVCPSHPFLLLASRMMKGTSIGLGAQDIAWSSAGAFTGEVSASMLRECGCTHVIIGHSERRKHHPDEDGRVAAKLNMALEAELTPILCVGENLSDRENSRTYRVLRRQLEEAFYSLALDRAEAVILAYEPVWAIGTGQVASVSQVSDAHGFLRKTVGLRYSVDTASRCRILYGGSVKAGNAGPLSALDDVDGFLVGGAGLDVESFMDISRQAAAAV